MVREDTAERRPEPETARRRPPPRHKEEVWVFSGRVDDPEPARRRLREAAAAPPKSGRARPGQEAALPADVTAELTSAVGKQRGAKLAERMAAAARAYERDRYQDALRITKGLVDQVPESAAARELHGLACYRMGRWREAIRHLEAARGLAGDDPSQLPVLMDCHRAMGHHRRVGDLWAELRAASPDADVLAEGRLVLASDMGDRGDLHGAVELLMAAGAGRTLRHPAERHVRQWYVLGDLLERAGDVPRARDFFTRVVEADPELADAALRLAALGPRSRRPRSSQRSDGPGSSRRSAGSRARARR